MYIKKTRIFMMVLIIGSCFFCGSDLKAQSGPVLEDLPSNYRKIFRNKLINHLIERYRENNTILKIHEYMVIKNTELYGELPDKFPDVLILDTFNKTGDLFEHTKSFIGNSLACSYEPDRFEKSVQKYLWLKGIGFLVMGIGEEHKLAFSYFYLPGNENLKEEFLKEIVHYSFPEVPEVSENEDWYNKMVLVMGRIGYNIFNIKKYGL